MRNWQEIWLPSCNDECALLLAACYCLMQPSPSSFPWRAWTWRANGERTWRANMESRDDMMMDRVSVSLSQCMMHEHKLKVRILTQPRSIQRGLYSRTTLVYIYGGSLAWFYCTHHLQSIYVYPYTFQALMYTISMTPFFGRSRLIKGTYTYSTSTVLYEHCTSTSTSTVTSGGLDGER